MNYIFAALGFVSNWSKSLAGSSQRCGLLNCSGPKSLWRRLWARCHGTQFDGVFYCHPQCLETAVRQRLSRLQNQVPTLASPNRMPLGLMMVARGKITYDQVLLALDAQRTSGTGNIGEWFEKLGLLTAQEVAGALALQWGCPISSSLPSNETCHKLPLAILESFLMWPLHYVSATNVQYIAFGKRFDRAALYEMEKMLGCRVQPCVAPSKLIAGQIERLRQERRSGEVEFLSMHDPLEIARIAISYIAKLETDEIRMSRVGEFIWLLLRNNQSSQRTTHLLFRLQQVDTQSALKQVNSPSVEGVGGILASKNHIFQKRVPTDPRTYHVPAYNVRLNSGTAKANVTAAKIDR